MSFEEVAERKFRCCDIVLLEPLRSPAELTTHWAPYFANEPVVQAMVWATVKYRNMDHLREIARGVELVSGSAAGHFVVVAGRANFLGYDVPAHAALAARDASKDSLINPDGGRYGVLDAGFGPHEDRAVVGLEGLDTIAWKDRLKKERSEKGVNVFARTDGLTHAFWLRTLSKDVQHSQADAVRGRQWFIGTTCKYLRRVTPGQCNTPVMRRTVAEKVTRLLLAPFTNRAGTCKDGLSVQVTPGASSDPRELVITLGLPKLAFVEKVVIHAKLLGDD